MIESANAVGVEQAREIELIIRKRADQLSHLQSITARFEDIYSRICGTDGDAQCEMAEPKRAVDSHIDRLGDLESSRAKELEKIDAIISRLSQYV